MFVNTTHLTQKIWIKINRRRKVMKFIFIFYVGLVVLCLFLGIVNQIENPNELSSLILTSIFLALLPLLVMYLQKKQIKKMRDLSGGTTIHYRFTEAQFEIEQHSEFMHLQGTYLWGIVNRVELVKDYYLIFVNQTNAFPIAKSGFLEGDVELFSAFLVAQVGRKYKGKK